KGVHLLQPDHLFDGGSTPAGWQDLPAVGLGTERSSEAADRDNRRVVGPVGEANGLAISRWTGSGFGRVTQCRQTPAQRRWLRLPARSRRGEPRTGRTGSSAP